MTAQLQIRRISLSEWLDRIGNWILDYIASHNSSPIFVENQVCFACRHARHFDVIAIPAHKPGDRLPIVPPPIDVPVLAQSHHSIGRVYH